MIKSNKCKRLIMKRIIRLCRKILKWLAFYGNAWLLHIFRVGPIAQNVKTLTFKKPLLYKLSKKQNIYILFYSIFNIFYSYIICPKWNAIKRMGQQMGHLWVPYFWQKKQEHTIGQRQPLQEVMLGKLDSYA